MRQDWAILILWKTTNPYSLRKDMRWGIESHQRWEVEGSGQLSKQLRMEWVKLKERSNWKRMKGVEFQQRVRTKCRTPGGPIERGGTGESVSNPNNLNGTRATQSQRRVTRGVMSNRWFPRGNKYLDSTPWITLSFSYFPRRVGTRIQNIYVNVN